MVFDPAKVREDFPILQTGLVYLDSAATSLTPEPVVAKELEYYHAYKANIHRGVHRWSERASQEYESAYGKLRAFFHAPREGVFVSTRNTTEAINAVALGLDFRPDQNVVTTGIEHHSNLLPWVRLERTGRIEELRVVPPRNARTGEFALEDFEKAIGRDTRLVAVTAASNVLGCKLPIERIAKAAHDHGARVLVDAAQAAGHSPADFTRWGADFVAFSGHKMMGPSGTGALYLAPGVELEPWFLGGGTIREAALHEYALLPPPERFEAGTPHIAGWIGLGTAVEYLQRLGLENIEAHERALAQRIADGLAGLGADVYGPARRETGVVAFNLPGKKAHEVAAMVDELGKVAIRSGHHCAMPLTKALGVEATARASVHAYNTEGDVRAFLEAVQKVASL